MKKVHRFITSYEVIDNKIEIKDKELIHQWKNVLKFKIGEILTLANTTNGEALCSITELSKSEAILSVAEVNTVSKEGEKKVTLYLAILKRENFELVVQKATEIGVHRIVPIITEHTIKTGLKYDRLEKIAQEAAELCGRNSITEIAPTMKYTDALIDCKNTDHQIIFDISGEIFNPRPGLGLGSVALFIGPEGGFTEKEIFEAKENNIETASLGSLMLRGETAAIIASFIAVN
ncbi:MAG: 16S rRNA (uracil(1498)-N(3))-methyltransferase [Candidatus Pacebacteria bacterium]|nr:16S rRNA (uracil(1498)-N(3))-methyltransferase [Candidatus Paceibacterota bacterium]MBP9715708.1 16S rRNA (uracil(1498)-N(3))-methyltransferase [Candidatus Paceibacterota bacterium]